jgi:hypothetical protein
MTPTLGASPSSQNRFTKKAHARKSRTHQRGFLESGRGYRRLAARQFIVEGILAARRQSARDLAHNLNDLPHNITAVAAGN